MFNLLSRIFIKDREDVKNANVRKAYGVLCGALGIIFNLILFGFKFAIGLITGSIAIQADSFNNVSDVATSALSIFGFKASSKKPTKEMPFGQARIEYVLALIVSTVIIIMGFSVVKDGVIGIIKNASSTFSTVAVVILCSSILVKLYMAFYNYKASKKIGSTALKAVALDSVSDCVSTFVVLCCLLINKFFAIDLDNYCGILVGLIIMFAGYKNTKGAIGCLLGKRPSEEIVKKIYNIVLSYPIIYGIHDLVVHDYGPNRLMVSLHVEVLGDNDIFSVHEEIDGIMNRLDRELNCVSVIHMDPISLNDEKTNEMKALVLNICQRLDCRITIHDFRTFVRKNQTNVIFDASIPHDLAYEDEETKSKLCQMIENEFENVKAVIQIDKSYI